MKTLQEYITSEFGIVPDYVQLEQIREISEQERIDKIIENMAGRVPEPLPKYCKVGNKEYCFLHYQCKECNDNKDF
jgi:hypothetical protein